jgi:hypothetical protein
VSRKGSNQKLRDDVVLDISAHAGSIVFVGDKVLRVGDEHGALVRPISTDEGQSHRLRPPPSLSLPESSPPLGRSSEIAAIEQALESGVVTQVCGAAGIGKTALLKHVVGRAASIATSGVVLTNVGSRSAEDLLQSLFEVFFESHDEFKPTGEELRRYLSEVTALVALDDVDLPSEEAATLLSALARCQVLIASPKPSLPKAPAITLTGLPEAAALELLTEELAHQIEAEDLPDALAICAGVEGSPLLLIQAARMARVGGRSLADLARLAVSAPSSGIVTPDYVDTLSEQQRSVLAVLTTFAKAPLRERHIAAISKVRDVATELRDLVDRALVQTDGLTFSVAGAAGWALGQVFDREKWASAGLQHFATWAEAHKEDHRLLAESSDALLTVMDWASEFRSWAELLHLVRQVEGAFALTKRWGAWESALRWGLTGAHESGDRQAEAWCLHQLGSRALCVGDHASARRYLKKAVKLRRALGDEAGELASRGNLDLLRGRGLWGCLRQLSGARRALVAAVSVTFAVTAIIIWLVTHGGGVTNLVTLDEQAVSFAVQPVGTSATRAIQVRNTGGEPLRVSSVSLGGTDPGDFATDGGCQGVPLDPGASCAIGVTFTPAAAGQRSATLTIDYGTGSTVVPLSGNGTAGSFTLDQPSLDFGDQPQGTASDPRTLTVSNGGDASLLITGLTLGGTDPGDFATDGGCQGVPLDPGASCAIGVTFTPAAAGQRSATLTIDYGTGSTVVPLSGNGTVPQLEPDPAALDFGVQLVGTSSKPRTITVTNSGKAPANALDVTIPGSDFSFVNRCPDTLDPGTSCVVEVTFAPAAPGSRVSSLLLTGDGVSSSVTLTGIGTTPPLLLDPAYVDYGDQLVGTGGETVTISVTNNGSADLAMSAPTIVGSDPQDFVTTDQGRAHPGLLLSPQGSCFFVTNLMPGDSCTVTVFFYPTALGPRSATLDFSYDAPGSPQSVSLSGNGVATQADLYVSDLTDNSVTVTNDGSADAPAFVVEVVGVMSQTVSGLAAGMSVILDFGCTDGTLTANADVNDDVSESNESNNSLTVGGFIC